VAKEYRDDFGIVDPRSRLLKHLDNIQNPRGRAKRRRKLVTSPDSDS
jgi:hypothetical protein